MEGVHVPSSATPTTRCNINIIIQQVSKVIEVPSHLRVIIVDANL